MSSELVSERKRVPLSSLRANEVKLREKMSDTKQYEHIKNSMQLHGLFYPPAVVPTRDKLTGNIIPNSWTIIDGFQRFNAAGDLKWLDMEVTVYPNLKEDDIPVVQFITNEARVPDKAKDLVRHLSNFAIEHPDLTQTDVAHLFGISSARVSQLLKVSQLVKPVLELVESGDINLANAYVLTKLPEEHQAKFIGEAGSMTTDKFVAIIDATRKEIARAAAEGKTANIEDVIVPHVLPKEQIEVKWVEAQDAVDASDAEDPDYKRLQGRLEMVQEVLQVDAASLAKKKEEKERRKLEAAADRQKKRAELEDKKYQEILRKQAQKETSVEVSV